MNFPIILIGILVILLVTLAVLVLLRARGMAPPPRRPVTRVQLAVAAGATMLLAVLWLRFDLTPALLPVLMVPIWIPLLRSREPATPSMRLLLIGLFSLGLAALVAISLYLLLRG